MRIHTSHYWTEHRDKRQSNTILSMQCGLNRVILLLKIGEAIGDYQKKWPYNGNYDHIDDAGWPAVDSMDYRLTQIEYWRLPVGIDVGGILGLIILIADIWAIVSTFQSHAPTGKKVLWIVLVLLLPIVGFIVWLFLGPKSNWPVKRTFGNHRHRNLEWFQSWHCFWC